MKPILISTKINEAPKPFRHLRDFCQHYGLKENTVCRWKFPKFVKRLGITVYREYFLNS